MGTTFLTDIFADVPIEQRPRLIATVRKATGTRSCDVWLPWTERLRRPVREGGGARMPHGVCLYVRHEIGLSAGMGEQDPFRVARRFLWAIREAFPGIEDPSITTTVLDRAHWVSAEIREGLIDTATDAAIAIEMAKPHRRSA